jgi:hypothetical protein
MEKPPSKVQYVTITDVPVGSSLVYKAYRLEMKPEAYYCEFKADPE